MKPWRVTVADGHLRREAGFAIAIANAADEARKAVTEFLTTDTAYGSPYEVSAVEPHEHPVPHVLLMNWGEWDAWPAQRETPDPRG